MAGSLIDRGKNKWELRVSNGYDENHKQIRYTKTIYAKNRKEANVQLASFYLEVVGRLPEMHNVKFSVFIKYWNITCSTN